MGCGVIDFPPPHASHDYNVPVCRKIYAYYHCCLADAQTSVMSNDIVPHVTAGWVSMGKIIS